MVARNYRRPLPRVRRVARTGRRRLGVTAPAIANVARVAVGAYGAYQAYAGARRNTTVPTALVPLRAQAGRFASKIPMKLKRIRKVPASGGGGGQLYFKKNTVGRTQPLTLQRVMRLLSNGLHWRWQSLNKLNSVASPGVPGKQILQCYSDTGVGNSPVPLHVYNLTAYGNNTASLPPCGSFLSFTDQGTPIFAGLPGQASNGTDMASMPWQYEASDVINKDTAKYVKFDWFDIRLLLHGCTAQPTFYDVMLVTFTKDIYDPLENVTDANDLTYRSAFWQTMVRNLVTNPINIGHAEPNMGGMRVIRRYRTLIQPSSSTDEDKNPEAVQHKIFLRDGGTRNFDYGGAPLVTDTNIFQPVYTVENMAVANFQNQPRPSSRLWLLVRASNTTSVAPASVTRVDTPSYDICMRRHTTTTNNGR